MTLSIDVAGKRFSNGAPILDRINITLPERQFVCLLGPSGCGKTTLLQIIAGLLQDDNHNTERLSNLAYVFQEPRLMPWLNVLDNILLVTQNQPDDKARALQLLESVHLSHKRDAFPNHLSGGQQRRVALVRAFVTQPKILLMDEPFSSLEEPLANKLRLQLLDLWNVHPITILFVTHNLKEAVFLSDRILFMGGSPTRITLDKTIDLPRPRKALDSSQFQALYRQLQQQYPDGT